MINIADSQKWRTRVCMSADVQHRSKDKNTNSRWRQARFIPDVGWGLLDYTVLRQEYSTLLAALTSQFLEVSCDMTSYNFEHTIKVVINDIQNFVVYFQGGTR
jgi:hypothetical protein